MVTILVVEDEQYIRENLEELLVSEGYKVLTGNDGEEGLNIAKSTLPDLILSDIRMPKLDGIQLLKELQEYPPTSTIPVIFLTAKIELNEMREGMLSGADDYIPKPFKSKDVLKAVEMRLKKKKNYDNIIETLRSTFIKNVPHELRTPLISILGFSELIENDLESISAEEIKDMAQRINKSGKRLHRRIEKLIKLGFLLSNDRMAKNDDIFNAVSTVEPESFSAMLNRIGEQYGRKQDITAVFHEAELHVEHNNLETVLEELVENAIKFSEAGTSININGNLEGDSYVISVTDCGTGICISDISEVDIFRKIDLENENKEGLGLGLAIVKRIMEIYGGTIKVSGEKDKYTKVEVAFRIVKNN